MKRRKTVGFIVLSVFTAFLLGACGGGGDSAPDLTPMATTTPASSITGNSAVLNAIVNPKALSTTAWFEYSKDPTLATNVTSTAPQALGSGSADTPVTQNIPGLDSGQTYYFRVTATSSAGTKDGTIFSFSTLPLPTVTTNPADAITTTGADLNAIVNPNGRETYAWFEYGPTTALGTAIDNQLLGTGTDNVIVNTPLTGLTAATQYYFRIVANSSAGRANGTTLNFTTAGGVPLVTTNAPTSVTTAGATLNAAVNPSGLATVAWFEYGMDNTFTSFTRTDNQAITAGTSPVNITAAISGYTVGQTVYYRVAASNSVGPSLKGDVRVFTTLNPTPTANAGADQSVYTRSATGATVVTLDASGSAADPSKTITSYAWTQLSGGAVALDDPALETPSFTAPQFAYGPSMNLAFQVTVTDNAGLSATDNVTVTVNWGYLDDFNTDTTGTYTVVESPNPNAGGLAYDVINQEGKVTTGGGNTIFISHTYGLGSGIDTGVFSMDFFPYASYGAGAGIAVSIGDSAATYIRVSSLSGEDVVQKYRAGALIDSQPFTANPTLNINNPIRITFNRTVTTVEAFGATVTLGGGDQPIPMTYYAVQTRELDANYDNFKMEIRP